MVRQACGLAIVLGCVAIPAAQTRPNLTGTWTLGAKQLGAKQLPCPPGSLTLVQDETSLHVRSGVEARETVYRFDGTDTREALPPPPVRSPDLSPGTWQFHKTASVARAAWNGDRFVVVTHTTMAGTWPEQMPGTFDREFTSRTTYSSDGGRLLVEQLNIIDPLPGGTERHLTLPDSSTCTYERAGEPKPSSR
jgi:hypothetical protein